MRRIEKGFVFPVAQPFGAQAGFIGSTQISKIPKGEASFLKIPGGKNYLRRSRRGFVVVAGIACVYPAYMYSYVAGGEFSVPVQGEGNRRYRTAASFKLLKVTLKGRG